MNRGCKKCGVIPARHQRIGASWLYFVQKGLLADTVGLGKTIQGALVLALMAEQDQLTKTLIIMRPAAIGQWRDELTRLLPSLRIEMAVGKPAERVNRYVADWDVMLIGQQMFLRDIDRLLQLGIRCVLVDDVDALRNKENRTAWAIKWLAREVDRFYVMSGTPLQNRLHELYSLLEPMGGRQLFGSEAAFKARYVREEPITLWDERTGRRRTVQKVVGYKNMAEFKDLIAPVYLRRTHRDLDGSDLPSIMPPTNVWLDLHKAQRDKYEELQRGVIKLMRAEGEHVKKVNALSQLAYGAAICAGLPALGEEDGPGRSCKLDWLMEMLTGDLEGEKVLVFCGRKDLIRAAHARMDNAKAWGGQKPIKYVTFWGDEPDPGKRAEAQKQFWEDPETLVCIGTTAMEQSLNLQVSNVLINMDMILNPARMEQLLGRIRRFGSAHSSVWVYNVLTADTQEERYLPLLERKQALADFVWGETSEMFEQLSSLQMLQLISP